VYVDQLELMEMFLKCAWQFFNLSYTPQQLQCVSEKTWPVVLCEAKENMINAFERLLYLMTIVFCDFESQSSNENANLSLFLLY